MRIVIADIHTSGQQGSQKIVQWRLTALMLPGCFYARHLHRQLMIGDDLPHDRIMPRFIRRLENGRGKTVDHAQQQVGEKEQAEEGTGSMA